MSLLPRALASLLLQAPLPEGNAYVQGLVQRQRTREAALNNYTYDLFQVEDQLDKKGNVKRRETKQFEIFHVKGRPVRRLVARDDKPFARDRQAKEDKKVREKVDDILKGNVAVEQPGVRLSAILERYEFRSLRRESVDGRSALVLEFVPRPGKRKLDNDNVLRNVKGLIWVDETEREIVRAEVQNTGGIKFALGLGASLSDLDLTMEFRKVDDTVWLPLRVEAFAAGRLLLLKGFRIRTTATYSRYRRFQVESEERLGPLVTPTPTPTPSPVPMPTPTPAPPPR